VACPCPGFRSALTSGLVRAQHQSAGLGGSEYTGMSGPDVPLRLAGHPAGEPKADLAELLGQVARGDESAFEAAYEQIARPVYGLVRKVVRDPAQTEEVAQEVLLEIWRTATRFDASRGSAMAWVVTIAHRRAIDRIRATTAQAQREQRVGTLGEPPPASVADTVESQLDAERVRRCLGSLTSLQRESVTLAYYGGYTYPQVAALLGIALGTIKTRIRDGLIRMRDCLGVSR
jgi:RNA polymerase sigma-70 factor, ECF subfamily